nr:hypothetical protein Pyn_20557 [Ipomoea batatas]
MEGQRPLVSPPVKNWGLTITSQYAFLSCLSSFMIRSSGVLGVEEPHQSIPNLVVKLYCGDDTADLSLQAIVSVGWNVLASTSSEIGGAGPNTAFARAKGNSIGAANVIEEVNKSHRENDGVARVKNFGEKLILSDVLCVRSDKSNVESAFQNKHDLAASRVLVEWD